MKIRYAAYSSAYNIITNRNYRQQTDDPNSDIGQMIRKKGQFYSKITFAITLSIKSANFGVTVLHRYLFHKIIQQNMNWKTNDLRYQ